MTTAFATPPDSTAHRATVLVQHPDPLVRAGLELVLRAQPALDVRGGEAPASGADVVITDYDDAMRLAAAKVLPRKDRPVGTHARIVVLTANDREADVRRAVLAGVDGYLLFGGPLGELVEAVTAVADGRRYLCRMAAQRAAESLGRESLTSREIDVLRLAASGESNKAIARRLRIEPATVKSHMTAIMAKLGASSRTHAAGLAATRGLVEAPAASARSAPAERLVGLTAHAA